MPKYFRFWGVSLMLYERMFSFFFRFIIIPKQSFIYYAVNEWNRETTPLSLFKTNLIGALLYSLKMIFVYKITALYYYYMCYIKSTCLCQNLNISIFSIFVCNVLYLYHSRHNLAFDFFTFHYYCLLYFFYYTLLSTLLFY